MKTIEKFLNILHFCLYKAHYKSHLFANKINPFRLLAETPIIKRRLKKKGIINIQTEIDKTFGDRHFGLSITVAGGFLWGIIGTFLFSLLIIFNVPISMPFSIICVALPAFICYVFVLKNDKYLKHFARYEKWSKAEMLKYSWITFGSIVVDFLLFYLGLKT